MIDLSNKVILITGGTSGIGYAVAKEARTNGAEIIITGSERKTTKKAADELGAVGIVCDQRQATQITELAAQIQDDYQKIHGVFLNAGTAEFSPVEAVSEATFNRIMGVNVKGTYFLVQQLLPTLRDGASVVFNASINAHIGAPTSSLYSMSKGALLSLNKVLASELAPKGIRVNAISPGPVATPLYNKLGLTTEQQKGFSEHLQSKILLKRFAQATEIAKLVAFLLSDNASFITGTEVTIDGGLTVNPTS